MERLLRGLKTYGPKLAAYGDSKQPQQPQQAQAPSPRIAPQGAPESGAMRVVQSPEFGDDSLTRGSTEPESKASLQPSKSLDRLNPLEEEELLKRERARQQVARQARLVDLAMPRPQRQIDIKGTPWNKEKASSRFKEGEIRRRKAVEQRLAKLTANELAVMQFVLEKQGTIEEIAGKLGLVGPVSRLSADDCARVGRHLEAETIELITKELRINAETARQCRARAFHKMVVNTADELAALLRCTGVTLAGPGKA